MNSDINTVTQVENAPSKRVPALTWGVTLVAIGTFFLLWNLDVLDGYWFERYGLIVMGLALTSWTLYRRRYRFFLGVVLFGTGCFHLYLDGLPYQAIRDLWPVYLLIPGVACLLNFVVRPSRWFSLLCGLVLNAVGWLWLAREQRWVDYDWFVNARALSWPLIFITAGIILIAVAIVRNRHH